MAGIQDFLRNNSSAFLQGGVGLLSGRNAQEQAAMGFQGFGNARMETVQKNKTVEYLKRINPELAEAVLVGNMDPRSALDTAYKQKLEAQKPMRPIEVGGRLVDPNTYKVIADFSDPNAKLTSDEREYQRAKSDGFQGNFMDYQIKMKEAGRQQVNIDTGEKLPSGYRWTDPNNREAGVTPIPGGPATQVPAELAARVGMGENWLQKDLPQLKEDVKAGSATGPIDQGMAWAGYGKPAEIKRKFQSGVEVLSRLLSGAGMTQVEIDEKASRYMPTPLDTPESLQSKLDQLEAEIRAAGNAAMRGRGSMDSKPSAPSGAVVDYRDYFKK